MFAQKSSDTTPMMNMVIHNTRKEMAQALSVLDEALAIPHYKDRKPYICLGCQIGPGELRDQIIPFAAYPLYQKLASIILNKQLVLQAYHPQAQEDGADKGPGGVIGIRPLGDTFDTSASTSVKMWHWVNENTNFAYKAEKDAETELWDLTQQRCGEALMFLSRLTDNDLRLPVFYRHHMRHQMRTVLGITAVRNLLTEKLGKKIVLIDDHRLIGEDHLLWEHFYQ